MILMRVRELAECTEHRQTLIVLEDERGERTLAIAADPDESKRLARELTRKPEGEHPIFDFVESLVRSFQAAPAQVVLEYVAGAGLAGAITFVHPAGELTVPCYPSDALALAHRTSIPIYVNPDVFTHVEPFDPAAEAPAELAEWLAEVCPADFGPGAAKRRRAD